MKYLREALALIADILAVSPIVIGLFYLIGIVAVSILAIIGNFVSIQLIVPLPLAIFVGSLALYPLAKLVENYKKKASKQKDRFIYQNISWKRSRNLFGSRLVPQCPHCGKPLIKETHSPTPVLWNALHQPFPRMSNTYVYVCTIHGNLLTTEKPDIELYAQAFGED